MLNGKHIVVGVTGGIAAYKVCYLVREFIKARAQVRIVMTEAATKFVAPLTFATLSGHEVLSDLWAPDHSPASNIATRHIDLANWADVFVIAPASANTIAKLTYGLSDNLLTIIALATPRPIVLAPTMDADMYLNPITQHNLAILKEHGYYVIQPAEGELASGLKGPGRLPEIETIFQFVCGVLDKSVQDFQGKHLLVTAGPTYEAIDPVRFIGNRSSGKMGFALASAAAQRGARIILISGPVHIETPRNVTRVNVETAEQMHKAVLAHAAEADVIIMSAAVADYAPRTQSAEKIKKNSNRQELILTLTPTPDILQSLGTKKRKNQVLVGFALETQNELRNAKEKLKKKNLDLIVLNSLKDEGAGFGTETNVVTIIDRNGKTEKLGKMPKIDVAREILHRVKKHW
ncbi:MAG: bifunctional phosphopantothenoylcysteine decarboxylase/phosphopantothenate--cysteine ligase CoaBC [bacterium]